MRHLTIGVLVLLAACGRGDSTAPASVVGYYRLASVHGQPLPFEFPADSLLASPDTGVFITTWREEILNLRPDGRAEDGLQISLRSRYSGDPAYSEASWLDFYTGRWTMTGNGVRAVFDSIAEGGGPMTLLAAPLTLTFERSGSGTLVSHYPYRHSSLGTPPPVVDYQLVYRKE